MSNYIFNYATFYNYYTNPDNIITKGACANFKSSQYKGNQGSLIFFHYIYI